MFSIRQNIFQRSTRLPRKRNLLGMDYVYNSQPYVHVVAKNENAISLDLINNGKSFTPAYDNTQKSFPFILSGSNHPDVQLWQYLGGSANSTTLAAMNAFCNTIDSNGLRSKLYRLNLMCGNNLASCLIPLYTSTHHYNPPLGYSRDVNFNFIESDYVETGSNAGLTSSGADPAPISVGSKYLDLGIKPNEINTLNTVVSNMHLSACVSCTAIAVSQQFIFYNTFNYSNIYSLGIQLLGGVANLRTLIGSQGINSPITPSSSGFVPLNFYITSRISTTDARNYQNGSQIGSTNTTSATAILNSPTLPFLMYRASAGYYGNMRISSYSLGLGLNSTEASTLSSAISTFNSALNRS